MYLLSCADTIVTVFLAMATDTLRRVFLFSRECHQDNHHLSKPRNTRNPQEQT